MKRRGAMVVISDFYDDEEGTRRELRRVSSRGHDVAMLQLTSPQERRFPFQGDHEFEDLETGERRIVNANAIEAEYRSNIEAFLTRCRDGARRDGIDYGLMSIDEPPEKSLREYLLRRGARHQSDNAARQWAK
jgi:dienelactone hydrolase